MKVGRSLAYQLFHAVGSIDRSFLLESLDKATINDACIWAVCIAQLLLAVRTELHDVLVLLLAQETGPGSICRDDLELLLCLSHSRLVSIFGLGMIQKFNQLRLNFNQKLLK